MCFSILSRLSTLVHSDQSMTLLWLLGYGILTVIAEQHRLKFVCKYEVIVSRLYKDCIASIQLFLLLCVSLFVLRTLYSVQDTRV